MAKPMQIAVKHGGSDPWIFKLRFHCLVLLFVAMGYSLYGYQTVAIFVWRLNSQEARNGPTVDVSD